MITRQQLQGNAANSWHCSLQYPYLRSGMYRKYGYHFDDEDSDGTGPRADRRPAAPGTWRLDPSPRRLLLYGLAACIRSLHVTPIVSESAS